MTKRNRKRKYATAMHKRKIAKSIAQGAYNGHGYYEDDTHIKRIDYGSVRSKLKRIAAKKYRSEEKAYNYAQNGGSYKKTYAMYD